MPMRKPRPDEMKRVVKGMAKLIEAASEGRLIDYPEFAAEVGLAPVQSGNTLAYIQAMCESVVTAHPDGLPYLNSLVVQKHTGTVGDAYYAKANYEPWIDRNVTSEQEQCFRWASGQEYVPAQAPQADPATSGASVNLDAHPGRPDYERWARPSGQDIRGS